MDKVIHLDGRGEGKPKPIRRFPRLPRRFPRLPAEDVAKQAKADRLATLDAQAFDWIARGRPANIELGRVFNQIKALLKHGEWKPYFAKKFTSRGISLRTATEYMGLARQADEITKKADFALFPPATDRHAQEINDTNEEAQAEVELAGEQSPETSKLEPEREIKKTRTKRVRLDGIYKLPLFMTGEQKDATDQLLESKKWSGTERKIMDLLQRRLIKYGFLNDSEKEEKDEKTSA
jgi:hypothetical protein